MNNEESFTLFSLKEDDVFVMLKITGLTMKDIKEIF